jgi:hypothetical protein
MAYTEEAMIAVLQKAAEVFRNFSPDGILLHPPISTIPFDGDDEIECFNIAIQKEYIQTFTGNAGRSFSFQHTGSLELNRLLGTQAEKTRKIQRHQREKLKIRLDVSALCVSFLAILFSATALGISALNRYWPLLAEYPVRIVGAVELLPEKTSSGYDGNKQTESSESDSGTGESCANVHEN